MAAVKEQDGGGGKVKPETGDASPPLQQAPSTEAALKVTVWFSEHQEFIVNTREPADNQQQTPLSPVLTRSGPRALKVVKRLAKPIKKPSAASKMLVWQSSNMARLKLPLACP